MELAGLQLKFKANGEVVVPFQGSTAQKLISKIKTPLSVLKIHEPSLEDAYLDDLPKNQREVFQMSKLQAMPVKEIAEKTGVSVNTVLSRKHYAVIFLRKRLNELYSDVLNHGSIQQL